MSGGGTSVARRARAGPSPAKAAEMLDNPPHGKALSTKQRRYFGGIKHGWKPTGKRAK